MLFLPVKNKLLICIVIVDICKSFLTSLNVIFTWENLYIIYIYIYINFFGFQAPTGPQTGTLLLRPVLQTMSQFWLSGPLPSSAPSSQRMQSTTFTPMCSAMNRPPVVVWTWLTQPVQRWTFEFHQTFCFWPYTA